MSDDHWFFQHGDEVLGPVSKSELCDIARRGGITSETSVSQDRTAWIKASDVSGLVIGPRQREPVAVPNAPGNRRPRAWARVGVVAGCVGVVVTGLVVLFVIAIAFNAPSATEGSGEWVQAFKPALDNSESGSRIPVSGPPQRTDRPEPVAIARLNLRWIDATDELLPIAQQLSPSEQAALGLAALATGADIYAARVTLSNTGNIPIRCFPENLRIHFGDETAAVYTINDRRFLQRCVVQPGQSASGLVTFTARMDIGAAIRLGNGGMSYADSTIHVTYD